MSNVDSTHQARAFHRARDLLDEVEHVLLENEAAANVILPFAQKASREGDDGQLWIVLYDNAKNVKFVLSCTRGSLGNYPIFVVASKAYAQRIQGDEPDSDLAASLLPLVRCLLDEVPSERVFSVFSIERVAKKFAEIFKAEAHARHQNHIQIREGLYYDATFTFCTKETLNDSLNLTFPFQEDEKIIATCRADRSHLEGVKALCKAFSETSEPYVLDDARAELEARTMIDNNPVWVHMVQKGGQAPEVACLIATTRESNNVTAVTKVVTAEHWRGRKCAARLLRRVCGEIFKEKQRIVLYVGNSDEMSFVRDLYAKVGFQGLKGQHAEGVERWVEVGFDGTTLGYW